MNTIKVSKMSWFEILKIEALLKDRGCRQASLDIAESLNRMKDINNERGNIAALFEPDRPIRPKAVQKMNKGGGSWQGCNYQLRLIHMPTGATHGKPIIFSDDEYPKAADKKEKLLDRKLHQKVRKQFAFGNEDSPFGSNVKGGRMVGPGYMRGK